jgi:hypothetical protein
MNCCVSCFNSAEINYVINSAGEISRCNTCGTKNVRCIDCRDLFFKFAPLFELYSPSDDGQPIAKCLLRDFPESIFAIDDETVIQALLKSIVADEAGAYEHYFSQNLILASAADAEVKQEMSSLDASWEQFSNEIKSVNRFHIATSLDLEKLAKLLSAIKMRLQKGKRFYRARLSGREGFSADEMCNPPSHKATAGRANPVGISYLYLAGDLETTIYESRAGLYDYVTVAEFRLLEDIAIVDLMNVDKYDPFAIVESDLLEIYMAFRPFLNRLSEELSRPKRPDDTELDYIPTQYLAEFIKSCGYLGIGYKSAQNLLGHNYAMFSPSKFECMKVSVHEIAGIQFEHAKLPIAEG